MNKFCIQNIRGVPNNFRFFLKCAATEKRLGTTGLTIQSVKTLACLVVINNNLNAAKLDFSDEYNISHTLVAKPVVKY